MKPLDCSIQNKPRCQECCRWMTFMLNPPSDLVEKYLCFYEQRGCKITKMPDGCFAVTVPTTCPHLSTNGCTIHNSKPTLCKEYDCRVDPFLKGGKYGEED